MVVNIMFDRESIKQNKSNGNENCEKWDWCNSDGEIVEYCKAMCTCKRPLLSNKENTFKY